MKIITVCLLGMIIMLTTSVMAEDDTANVKPIDTIKSESSNITETDKFDQLVIYYLHGNRRCMTCEKLEAYSEEALSTGFTKQIKDSSIVWRVVNFEEEGNEHYAKDYQLYNQSLIISKIRNGKEVMWTNLEKIWKLVGNKKEFIAYVQDEVEKSLKTADKE